jgi:uncharacterized protein
LNSGQGQAIIFSALPFPADLYLVKTGEPNFQTLSGKILVISYLIVSGGALIGYVISTIGGGGGSLLLVPILGFVLGSRAVAPVLSLGEMLSRPVRLVIFWKHIDWSIAKFNIPGSVLGAVLGAYIFANIELEWLQIIVGLFLISTVFQYGFGEKERSFPMRAVYFLPLGFFVSMLSALIGATGPVLNPFYLNYGTEKEAMVATKTINSFVAGLFQIGTYSVFGVLPRELWGYGVAIGIAAGLGSYIGKRILGGMESKVFRRVVIAVMVVSGMALIYRQLFAGS